MNERKKSPARIVAFVGVMAATLECAKLVLAFLPNVEVVTLLTALYAYVFGWAGVLAALVFVTVEPIIWGFGSWIISYYIYWPIVAFIFMLFGKASIKNRWLITATAVVLTAFFGVLSSLVDVGLFSGFFENFFERFAVYYARGAVFYAVQIACNAVIFPFLFRFLAEKLQIIKNRLA